MFPELTTERLLLQQVRPEDQQFIFEGLSHPEVIPFYGVRYDSFEATKTQMDWCRKIYEEGTGISWKIVDKQTKESLGDISVYFYKAEHKKAEVGFWLLPQHQYKGIAIEALQAVIHYWKTEKGLHRMEAFVEEGNIASGKLLEKGGFQYEGKMKDCEIKNGTYISLLVYGLILD
ncbi:MAG: N-acetyltransferase [Chitinophagaceae bacterium]|nr:MAG: N-acetyltransferase [Chitinophagaceae bacterium]